MITWLWIKTTIRVQLRDLSYYLNLSKEQGKPLINDDVLTEVSVLFGLCLCLIPMFLFDLMFSPIELAVWIYFLCYSHHWNKKRKPPKR